MKKISITALCVFLLGCELSKDSKKNPVNTNQTVDITALLARETEIVNKLPKSSNSLAFDIYKDLSSEKNITFSPLSISLALAMTYAGSRADTETAMKKVLYYGDNNLDFHKSYGEFANLLACKDRSTNNTVFKISNGLWIEDKYSVLDNFKNILADGYKAEVSLLDFANNPSQSTEAINSAVATQTNGEIDKLLKQDLDPSTRLVLTNALYFKSNWEEPFEASNTSDGNFTKSDNSNYITKFMSKTDKYFYGEDEQKQYLLMPYKDSEFAALFVLPKKDQLKAVQDNFDEKSYNAMLNNLSEKKVHVWLPKFSQRTSPNIKDLLTKRGLGVLFDAEKANLKGINNNSHGENNLYVDDIIHEAVVKIYEEGTTAAAATAVAIAVGSAMPVRQPEEIINFHAERPFLFNIIHKPTNTILFMGRVDEPQAQAL